MKAKLTLITISLSFMAGDFAIANFEKRSALSSFSQLRRHLSKRHDLVKKELQLQKIKERSQQFFAVSPSRKSPSRKKDSTATTAEHEVKLESDLFELELKLYVTNQVIHATSKDFKSGNISQFFLEKSLELAVKAAKDPQIEPQIESYFHLQHEALEDSALGYDNGTQTICKLIDQTRISELEPQRFNDSDSSNEITGNLAQMIH